MTPTPQHLLAAQDLAWVFTGIGTIFFLASLAWAIRESLRKRHALALLALLGGGIASLEESWIDRMIQLWYPLDSPLIMFTALGIPQPLYLHLIYPGFIGLGAYMTYLGLLRSPSGRYLWPTFFGIAMMDLAFEGFATWNGVFYYYGDQPFQLATDGWPAWVAFINAAGPMFGGWMMFKLEPHLKGSKQLLFALLPPLAYAGVYGATCWPTTAMMNSDVSEVWVWAASVLTMAMSVLIVLVIRLTLNKESAEGDSTHA